MATGHHFLLVDQANLIAVQEALRADLGDPTLLFSRQARAAGGAGPTTHWFCSQYLSDNQLAYLDGVKNNYPSFDYQTYMVAGSRTQNPTLTAFLAARGLEEADLLVEGAGAPVSE